MKYTRSHQWISTEYSRIEAGDKSLRRRVQRAYSYCASNDPRVHFGLGRITTVERVTVRWPGGSKKTFGPFQADSTYDLAITGGG